MRKIAKSECGENDPNLPDARAGRRVSDAKAAFFAMLTLVPGCVLVI